MVGWGVGGRCKNYKYKLFPLSFAFLIHPSILPPPPPHTHRRRPLTPVPSITQYGHSVSLVVCVGLCSTAGRGGARDQNVIYCSESQSITASPCGTLIPYTPCLKPITNAFCARHPIECLFYVHLQTGRKEYM